MRHITEKTYLHAVASSEVMWNIYEAHLLTPDHLRAGDWSERGWDLLRNCQMLDRLTAGVAERLVAERLAAEGANGGAAAVGAA